MTRAEAKQKIEDILAEATETESAVCYVTSVHADALELAIEALEQQEIVYCKECKYFSTKKIMGFYECYKLEICIDEDDYCCYGERRQDE